MRSIRARLTLAWTAASIGSLFVFSVALLAVRREILFQQLEQRVQVEAEQ